MLTWQRGCIPGMDYCNKLLVNFEGSSKAIYQLSIYLDQCFVRLDPSF